MIHFSFNIDCSESKVIFKRRKKANMSNKNALQGANVRTSCISLRTPATNKHKVNTQKSPPWACGKGCAEACAKRFSALNRSIDHLVPGPTRPRPFSVPTHSRWRAVRNLRKKMKFYCKISAEPSPQNLLLCSMLMLSSYRPSPCVSLSLQDFISALK